MIQLERRIRVAAGEIPADVLLVGGRVVDVFTGRVEDAAVALCDGMVAGVGDYDRGVEVIDCRGLLVVPSFIDAHIHVESTMLDVPAFASQVVPRGTGAVLADPHEIANVCGLAGIRYLLDAGRDLPLDVFAMVPSCVPATGLETAGAAVGTEEIGAMLSWPGVVGLGEMMNFPGVLAGAPPVLDKIRAAGERPVDGHAPGLRGKALNAYAAAGISSDHETIDAEEGREKLARGLHLLVREGSSERNLSELATVVTDATWPYTSLACDDRTALDLVEMGHMDHSIRRAVEEGIPPIRALSMATINTARHFGLRGKGAVAPGYLADLACVGSLEACDVRMVFHRGGLVARDGEPLFEGRSEVPDSLKGTVRVKGLDTTLLAVPAREGAFPVIELVPGQIVTRRVDLRPPVEGGAFQASPDQDLLKLVVVERHTGTGGHAAGFVKGFGLTRGAMASSVAHDSHNLIAAGVDDRDLLTALQAVADAGGGMAFASDGEVRALLPLPVAGLLSDRPCNEVVDGVRALRRAAAAHGSTLDAPFATLSFLALPVIPELRLTDRGLVDVMAHEILDL